MRYLIVGIWYYVLVGFGTKYFVSLVGFGTKYSEPPKPNKHPSKKKSVCIEMTISECIEVLSSECKAVPRSDVRQK